MSLKTKRLERKVKKISSEWENQKNLIEQLEKIEQEKSSLSCNKKKKTSTSKLLIVFLFVNCSLLELFACWSTIKMLEISLISGTMIDFTPLVTLIGSVVAETLGYAIYSLKAMKENTQGGVVYDLAIKQTEDESVG